MNFLWITTDHQQWRTIANRSICRTPNINRLVDSGLLFNRAYTPMPVCCPVRAMWASGCWPWHNGVHTQVHSSPSLTLDMLPDVVTYSQRLHDAGFLQGFVGKWHASQYRNPTDFGFDQAAIPLSFGSGPIREGALRRLPEPPASLGRIEFSGVREFSWPGSEPFPMWGRCSGPIELLPTTRVADGAVDMLQDFCRQEKPWHVAVHFQEPHDPYFPHERYLKNYPVEAMPVPASFNDSFHGKPGMHRRESESWGKFTERDVQEGTAHFFAYCEQIDEQVGRILDALDASGQADDTLVVFTADHGDMVGAHRMWIKSWMPYEEVYRMPLVVRGPGVRHGVTDRLVQTHDIPHTVLQMVGAEPLPHADGRSLKPLFQNADVADWEDAVMCAGYGCEFFVTQRMVITDRYKYVFNGFDFDEMYDLANDPDEMHNVIDDPAHAAARSSLRGKLYDLMARHEDPYGDRPNGLLGRSVSNRYCAPRYLPRS